MSFADAMREDGRFTRTENGAVALNTSGDARLDLFGTIGSLREADENRITTLFAEAYAQDKLFATKIAFYARDIRERNTRKHSDRTLTWSVCSEDMMICMSLSALRWRTICGLQ